MSNGSRVENLFSAKGETVSFGERFQASEQFDRVFTEGMALVERAAAYLDGDGRRESKGLPSQVTVLYATESMRLTTRLLELASWLLIRRALKEGEITAEQAEAKRARVKLQTLGRPAHTKGFADLPQGLRDLIDASFMLHDRIVQLDRAMLPPADGTDEAPVVNPVATQISNLEQAFALSPRRVAAR
ncbi:protease adaptor protein RcdA [Hyphomicrobium sp.]|uniref:protease adaptor protein RcdA n=1 Tax=Hyphomicrobium sp. TaxID=82 RepID=UPI003F7119D7